MKISMLKKVYVYDYTTTNTDGEPVKTWRKKGVVWLNIQQDYNELDRDSAGTINYNILKGRTNRVYNIINGNGISFSETRVPEYIVTASPKIGRTVTYTMEQYSGE